MPEWGVYPAEPDEAAALVRLEARAFGDRSWGDQGVRESMTAPGVSVLLGGEGRPAPPLGFALWRDLDGEAELLAIGVAPEARQGGLGAALLAAALAAARHTGAATMFLEVDVANVAACALYRRAGFAPAGLRKRYYRDGGDAAVMACRL